MHNRHFYNLLIILALLSFFALACTISSPWQQQNSTPSATPAPTPQTASDEDEKLKEKIAELEKKVEEQQKQKAPPVVKQTVPIIKSSGTYARVSSPNDGFLALRSEPNSDIGYRVLQIPHGATVQVLSCQNFSQSIGGRRGRWCRVSYDGYTGWAFDGWLVY